MARLRLGMRGENTANNDAYSSEPGRRSIVTDRVNNFSFKYYSVNPMVFEGYVEGDFIFTRNWEVGAGFSQSFYGVNSAQGWNALAMVRFRLPDKVERQQPSEYPDYTSPPTFKETTEQYDTKIFDESNPSAPPPAKAKPLRPKNQKKSVDTMLKETEKSLEKKKSPKGE
jgi:hypothetical protein